MKNIRLCKTTVEQDDSGVVPIVQVQYLSQVKNAVNAAPYGMHTAPELDTPCLLVTINNDSANSYILPLSFIARKNLAELKTGEILVGNFSQNASILFDEDGNISVSSEKDITVNANKITVIGTGDVDVSTSGDVNVSAANVTLGNATTIDGKTFLTHQHSGITSGPSNTGPVV